jgi:hypothetical protein
MTYQSKQQTTQRASIVKRISGLAACLLAAVLPLRAQENATATGWNTCESESRSSVWIGGSACDFIFNWKKKPVESHWKGLGFAFSSLDNLQGAADLNPTQSYSVMLNLMDYTVPLSHHFLFVTGLGFDWSRFHFRENTGLLPADGAFRFVEDPEREYKSSKLLVYYATIPFLLEYQTRIRRHSHFFLSGGVEGQVKCYSKSQLDIRKPQGGLEKIHYRNPNIPPLNARLVVRTGFDRFGFFGYCQLFSMFESGKGPDVRSRGIGLTLNFD